LEKEAAKERQIASGENFGRGIGSAVPTKAHTKGYPGTRTG